MKERETEAREKLEAVKSPAEIQPQQNRKHLTEPSWIEKMIYLTGVILGQEEPESDEEDPSKSEAA